MHACVHGNVRSGVYVCVCVCVLHGGRNDSKKGSVSRAFVVNDQSSNNQLIELKMVIKK